MTEVDQSAQAYTEQLYNYLQQLKKNYIIYEDIVQQVNSFNKDEEDDVDIPEEKQPELKESVKVLRQAINLTFLEYKTLLKTEKTKQDKDLETAKKKISESKKYFLELEDAEEYLLCLNAHVLKHILPYMLKIPTAVYDKK